LISKPPAAAEADVKELTTRDGRAAERVGREAIAV
jgi:hypothetical protein